MLSVIALSLLESSCNTLLQTDPVAINLLRTKLHGKTLRVVIGSPQLSVDVFFEPEKIRLEPTPLVRGDTHSIFEQRPYDKAHCPKVADCTLTVLHLADLTQFAADNFAGNLPVRGDIGVLQNLKALLATLEVDLGTMLQPLLGSSVSGQIQQFIQRKVQRSKRQMSQARYYSQEWLAEDNPLLAKRWQMNQLKQQTRTLNTDIEREHARMDALLAHATHTPHKAASPTSSTTQEHDAS